MVIEAMDTSSPVEESFIETMEVSSTSSSSIHVGWHIRGSSFPFIEGYRVHYQKVNSQYVQYGPELERTEHEYEIRNLVADTYYKVCLVVYRNYTKEFRECVDTSTTNWQLPVSIGSSIGAVLALSMIVLIVLLSRCQIPVQYRRKKRHNSSRYDTMSSNYHDEHYDFSETVTHGNDDEFVSECDHEEEGMCDMQGHDQTRQKHVEKVAIPNGLCKNHVHPHTHAHQPHRNSLGRIHGAPSHGGHHHPRPTRAYSISSDYHTAFLNQHFSSAKRDAHKLPLRAKECHELEETFLVKEVDRAKRARQFHREHSLRSDDVIVRDPDSKQRPPLVSQHSAQEFTYMDETPDPVTSARPPPSKRRCDETSSNTSTVNTDRVFLDSIKFDDLSAFGAAGGVKETYIGQAPVRHWDSTKPVEMAHKNNSLAQSSQGESSSFDEHAL